MSLLTQLAQTDSYYRYSDYSSSPSGSDAAVAGIAIVGALFFVAIATLVGYVIEAFLLSRIFKKAGVEQWVAWVPIYNVWKLYELGGQAGWWTILLFVPVVNIAAAIFMYIAMYQIGLRLQKEGWFVLLAIFVPIVWIIWLAFDSSKWQAATSPAAQPVTDDTKA